jgi:hypothetical protein
MFGIDLRGLAFTFLQPRIFHFYPDLSLHQTPKMYSVFTFLPPLPLCLDARPDESHWVTHITADGI